MLSLRSRLSQLAAASETYKNGARVISPSGGSDALFAIVAAVDETILMRRLTFRSGSNRTITMVVSGRRIVGILDVAIPGFATDLALLTDPLPEDDAAVQQALTETITAFVQTNEPISVSWEKASRGGAKPTAGLSVRMLAAAWDVDLDATPMKRFLKSCKSFVPAALHYEANVLADEHGDAKALQQVAEEKAPSAETAYLALYPEQRDGPWLINISYGQQDATCVLLARDGEETGLLTCDSASLGRVVGHWQRVALH
ncbi:MAG: hypothetical protein AAFQ66_14190 [Pseudomonadota bacterium]